MEEDKMKYRIKEVRPNIFAVIVQDSYDRAMLFCRAQEYYESPNPKFRGKSFSIWDYMKWYHKEYDRGFSYGADWSGFNIPLKVITQCYNKLGKFETPYDKTMYDIIVKINRKCCFADGYIIACGNVDGTTFKHELCHALYYTDKNYRKKMDVLTKSLPKEHYDIFKKNLKEMGYTTKVINDEIQAYLMHDHDHATFGKGVALKIRKKYNKLYQDAIQS
jgi:hypothetical protein